MSLVVATVIVGVVDVISISVANDSVVIEVVASVVITNFGIIVAVVFDAGALVDVSTATTVALDVVVVTIVFIVACKCIVDLVLICPDKTKIEVKSRTNLAMLTQHSVTLVCSTAGV